MDRDNRTRTGARAPGVKQAKNCLHGGASAHCVPGLRTGIRRYRQRVHEGRTQTARREELAVAGQAPSDMPAFQPDWRKSAVRNDRGDDGNVSIIRSLVRAIVLPGNRTHVRTLGSVCSTTELRPLVVSHCTGETQLILAKMTTEPKVIGGERRRVMCRHENVILVVANRSKKRA
jgi:hypothetical protein